MLLAYVSNIGENFILLYKTTWLCMVNVITFVEK